MPRVSVMIPAYNQAGFITRAIESALAQDYPDLEIVVSDDCSRDDTQAVVEGLIARHPGRALRYTRNVTNLGILRNYHTTLIDKVRGEWVVNLDADDFFCDPGFLSAALARAAQDREIVLVFADYQEFSEASGRTTAIRNPPHPAVMTDGAFFAAYAAGQIRWNHNAILYRREAALRTGCYWSPDEPRNDWESFLRMIAGAKVGFLDRVVAAWVQHGANETRRLDRGKYLRNFTLIDGVARHAGAQGMDEDFIAGWRVAMRRTIARDCAGAYARNRDLRGMIAFLSHSPLGPVDTVRIALDPRLLGRAALAFAPGAYEAAKRLRHRGGQ